MHRQLSGLASMHGLRRCYATPLLNKAKIRQVGIRGCCLITAYGRNNGIGRLK